jgi:predicted anti-sigma-YlaC factor YlaD
MSLYRPGVTLGLVAAIALLSGCSIRRLAFTRAADALAASGATFSSDNDPELIREAVPFSLKLMESLLAEAPLHTGLLTSLSSGFTQYGYAFVQQEAERVEETDLERARELHNRARKLFLRGRDYGLRGLEASHPGITNALPTEPAALSATTLEDVPLLYWTAVSWAGAISQAKGDPALVSDLPRVEALLYRALELDEDWSRGAIHTFLITYEMSRTTAEGDPVQRATAHFERAQELSEGRLAGPLVGYAESVCVPLENRPQFEALLRNALEIDVNAAPEWRLENLILQERANWLLNRADSLFLPPLE